ncbi:MAG: alpha/beta fold hydrolase [Caldithrix sp.]|nr:alpha/beta fold hydrolase [Caldithrix sp.]
MIRKSASIENGQGEKIKIDLRFEQGTQDAPGVIIVHGFKGFKDWAFFPDIAVRLADAGYVAVSFNFSRNGIGNDPNEFEALDQFALNTISHELHDLECVLTAVQNGRLGKRLIDPEQIAILGHSRGGGVAALFTAEHADSVHSMITWASVSSFYRYSEEQIKLWKDRGYIEVENARTKQIMRMNKTYWDDLDANRKRFDLLQAVQKIESPALFIHGSEDNTVSADESKELHDHCGSMVKRLEIVEGGDHTFGIKHPLEKVTTEYQTACDLTEHWLDNNLGY